MTDLDQFFNDRLFGLRDLDEYDLGAQVPEGELAPLLLVHHGSAAIAIVMEPLDNGVHIEVHSFWGAERCASPVEISVMAPEANIG